MNGATALPFASTISPPNVNSTTSNGKSQNFFLADMYAHSSARKFIHPSRALIASCLTQEYIAANVLTELLLICKRHYRRKNREVALGILERSARPRHGWPRLSGQSGRPAPAHTGLRLCGCASQR